MDNNSTSNYKNNPKESLTISPKATEEKIIDFIKDQAKPFNGVVIGISGGIDSAICATLAVKALGKDNVFGLILPNISTKESDIKDAEDLINTLKIEHKKINIKDIYETISKYTISEDKAGKGNISARTRMILLRDYAHTKGMLVLGTGNKSELDIGYFTKCGDGGVDILPIGDLYKTQVRALAKHLNIHENIIKKAPSAGLWDGQTDEDEMGITYEMLDQILYGIELKIKDSEIAQTLKIKEKTVEEIQQKIKNSKHKSDPLPIAKVR